MKTLTESEMVEWLSRSGISLDESGKTELRHTFSCRSPQDTGKKTALGKSLAALLRGGHEIAIWITEFGVWPSSESMSLFNGYRRSFGEHRSVANAPAHIFSVNDGEQLESIILLILYFFWDALLLDPSRHLSIAFSHDEMIDIRTKNIQTLEELKALFPS